MKINIVEPLSLDEDRLSSFICHLTDAGHEVLSYPERTTDPDELISRAEGADIVIIANCPFPSQVIDALPELKMLAVAFTGTDHIALDRCRAHGITVCNASGYSTVSVAELTIGLMIDLLRNITKLDPVTRAGGTKAGAIGSDLSGKTVGIIGTGSIGLHVAQLLNCFDVNLLGFSRTEKRAFTALGGKYVPLETLMAESDIITIHCPLNESTRGLIDAEKLGLMKRTAFLINCGRGPIVSTADLTALLSSRAIAGAALDVFDTEPPLPADEPLLSLENVIVTPHIAFATEEAFIRRAEIIQENIEAFCSGEPKNVVC